MSDEPLPPARLGTDRDTRDRHRHGVLGDDWMGDGLAVETLETDTAMGSWVMTGWVMALQLRHSRPTPPWVGRPHATPHGSHTLTRVRPHRHSRHIHRSSRYAHTQTSYSRQLSLATHVRRQRREMWLW